MTAEHNIDGNDFQEPGRDLAPRWERDMSGRLLRQDRFHGEGTTLSAPASYSHCLRHPAHAALRDLVGPMLPPLTYVKWTSPPRLLDLPHTLKRHSLDLSGTSASSKPSQVCGRNTSPPGDPQESRHDRCYLGHSFYHWLAIYCR